MTSISTECARGASPSSRAVRTLCALAASLLATACSNEHAPATNAQAPRAALSRPPIVLITLDTLRRDHLGCYGHFRATSPHLDALAADAIVFDRAVATMASTLPSHLSMLTGLYPHQHGIEENSLAVAAPFRPTPGCQTVAQFASAAGYETAAFVSALVVGPATGIQAGFATFDFPQAARRRGEETVRRALEWLDGAHEKPFFLWIHLFDPHEPNAPPPAFASRFRTDEKLEALLDARRIRPERLTENGSRTSVCRILFPTLVQRALKDPSFQPPAPDRAAVLELYNRYDGDVAYTDDCVGRVLERLRVRGLSDRAVVAVVADHGQSLGQHDWLGHGRITNENVIAPAIVRVPGEAPRRIAETFSLVDLFPTIVSRFDGAAWQPFLAQAQGNDRLATDRKLPHFALAQETTRPLAGAEPGREYALFADGDSASGFWRLVRRGESAPLLFDLRTDPDAYDDVAASHAAVVEELGRTLDALLARRPASLRAAEAPSQAAHELQKALKDLGYTGD